jgi:hypothetical protein
MIMNGFPAWRADRLAGGRGAVMTATLDDATKRETAERPAGQQAAIELVPLAKEQGLSLTGPDGLSSPEPPAPLESAAIVASASDADNFPHQGCSPALNSRPGRLPSVRTRIAGAAGSRGFRARMSVAPRHGEHEIPAGKTRSQPCLPADFIAQTKPWVLGESVL